MSAPQTGRSAIAAARFVALACVAASAVSAHAQTRRPLSPQPAGPTPRAGSWEITGGYTLVGGYDLDTANAELTRNTTTGSTTFVQFIADSSVASAHALTGLIAYYFSPRLAVEGGLRFGKPIYRVELSNDAEGAPDDTVEETLDQYAMSGSLVYHFPRARRSVVPFIRGGAGYLRELHEGQELVETGLEYHAAAGAKIWFGTARRRLGLRGEAGMSFRDGGFDFEEGLRATPTAGISLVYLF